MTENGAEIAPVPETELIKKTDITVVFGQGPVQEYNDTQGERGRTGLNLFSRLNALAAAELLASGKTEQVILSGGKTGTKKVHSEGELLQDVIVRNLWTRAKKDNGTFTLLLGEKKVDGVMPETENKSPKIPPSFLDAIGSYVKIETEAPDTISNFVNVINDYIDTEGSVDRSMTLLGIGFHAEDTHSEAGIGRLQKLADIFGLKGQVVSAEQVLKELVVKKKHRFTTISDEMQRLIDIADSHEVAQGKSRQEKILTELLDTGDWILYVDAMKNPDRLRSMLLRSTFAQAKMLESPDLLNGKSPETFLETADREQLQTLLDRLKQLVRDDVTFQNLQQSYTKTKREAFDDLDKLRDVRINQMLATSGPQIADVLGIEQGDISTVPTNVLLNQIRAKVIQIKDALVQISAHINQLKKKDGDIDPALLENKIALLKNRELLLPLLLEDKYHDPKSYTMLYGKGDDLRKQKEV